MPSVSVRVAAAEKFGICLEEISSDLTIPKHIAVTVFWPDVRDAGPNLEEVGSADSFDQALQDTIAPDEAGKAQDSIAPSVSSWSSSEDTSAVGSDTDNDEVDQELFFEAYTSFRNQSCTFRHREVSSGCLTRGRLLGSPSRLMA